MLSALRAGGYGTVAAMGDQAYVGALRRLAAPARCVASVCTGSPLLGAAGLLRGKRATCNCAWSDLLGAFGVTQEKGRVMRDGKFGPIRPLPPLTTPKPGCAAGHSAFRKVQGPRSDGDRTKEDAYWLSPMPNHQWVLTVVARVRDALSRLNTLRERLKSVSAISTDGNSARMLGRQDVSAGPQHPRA